MLTSRKRPQSFYPSKSKRVGVREEREAKAVGHQHDPETGCLVPTLDQKTKEDMMSPKNLKIFEKDYVKNLRLQKGHIMALSAMKIFYAKY